MRILFPNIWRELCSLGNIAEISENVTDLNKKGQIALKKSKKKKRDPKTPVQIQDEAFFLLFAQQILSKAWIHLATFKK